LPWIISLPNRSDETASPSKIPYLDGLRGYSILTVVIAHCLQSVHLPQWLMPAKLLFGNGVLGVDIFFAISGFLITTLLLREWQQSGSISLRAFYERRVARIFPAAYTYIAIIAVLAMIGVVQIRWDAFFAASFFTWNYGTLLNLFAGSKDIQLFNHFWSLSLEEQFYLLWPGCLLLFGPQRSRNLLWR
jgi:peptidoglycan/LPS O-acetylase OafA/YrhL